MKKLFLFATMLLFSGSIFANDVYLSATGNDANDGTYGHPVATLAKAYSLVNGYATIHVSGMIAVNALVDTGDGGNQLHFVGESAENDGFDGTGTTTGILKFWNRTVTFTNLSLKNATKETGDDGHGGAILAGGGNITFTNCVLSNNKANRGAAICMYNGTLNVVDSEVCSNNSIGGDQGGAIHGRGTSITITGSELHHNQSTKDGGAVVFIDGTEIVSNSKFYNNKTSSTGGAIFSNCNVTISESTFNNNNSSGEGGAVKTNGGTINVDESVFHDNYCVDGNGGAMRIHCSTNSITSSEFYANNSNEGGAIDIRGTVVNIDNCVFHNNHTNNYSGGAIVSFDNNPGSEIRNSKFYNNETGGQGGAVLTRCNLNFTNCEMYDNLANDGGAISVENTSTNSIIANCDIHDNTARYNGGGVEVYQVNSVIITNSVIRNNNADSLGGGIRFRGKSQSFQLLQSVVSGNVSHTHAGGLFFDLNGDIAQNIILAGSTITKNDCHNAGGAMFIGGTAREDHVFEIINCTITDNYTDDNVGNCPGINYQDGTADKKKTNLKIYNSILEGNYSRANSRYSDAWFKNAPVTIKNSIVGYIYERDQASYIATETASQVNTTPGNGRPNLYSMLSPLTNGKYYQVIDLSPACDMADNTLNTGYKDQLGNAFTTNVIGAVNTSTTNHGRGLVIPGVLDCVKYDFGGQNVSYFWEQMTDDWVNQDPEHRTKRPTPESGDHLSNTTPSSWINYTVTVENTGYYDIVANVQGYYNFSIYEGDKRLYQFVYEGEKGWNIASNNQTRLKALYLEAGVHTLKLTDFHDINVTSITFSRSKTDITVKPNYGYATFFDSQYAVEIPEDAEAYIFNKNEQQLEEVEDVVPANTGVVFKGEGTLTLYLTRTENTVENNALYGFDEATTTVAPNGGNAEDYYFYALRMNKELTPGSVGFYWMNATGEAFTSAAHKAYLVLPKTAGAKKAFRFDGNDDDNIATAISTATAVENNVKYNIAGQRVNANAKGIIIMNGKKYMK